LANGVIGIDGHDQDVTQLFRLSQKMQVPGVQEVKATVGEDDLFTVLLFFY
jgi:hypothetical protein